MMRNSRENVLVYIYINECVYIYMYVYLYVCMYVCMYACMHACMHACTNLYGMTSNIFWA